jgi:predicted Ser/Thr protein kinase
MLNSILKEKITDYLKKEEVRQIIGLKSLYNVFFLAQGEYNINFIICDEMNKYVFRVNTGSQLELENQIKYEFDSLKALESSGVTPKVHYMDHSKKEIEYGILIMEFLRGNPLNYRTDLKKAAGVFAQIHSVQWDQTEENHFIKESNLFSARITEAEKLLDEYLKSSLPDEKIKSFFKGLLGWARKNCWKEKHYIESPWHVINNTEVNSHNFIINEEKSYLIDWEKPVISDPCQDITQFLAPTTTLWKTNAILSKDQKESFFKEYAAQLKGRDKNIKERVQLYNPYLYLRALSWCAFAWLEYQKPNKAIKNMDTFNKIEEYLKLEFMQQLLKDYLKT